MTSIKLFVRQHCPNGIEAAALLKSQNLIVEVVVVDHLTNEAEFNFEKLPAAIFGNITVCGLPAIKEYLAIEH